MNIGDKIQIDVSGSHLCGSPFFYSGKAKVLQPINGRMAFLLERPIRRVNCGEKIEVYLAERSSPSFSQEQDEQNLSTVGSVSWHV